MSKANDYLTTPLDSENFCLLADLEQLKKVSSVNAIEAMVFYTGRILEATSNYCVTQLGEKAKSNVFSNIEYINDFNLLDDTTRQWAHALRRLANQFRHILKPTEENDGSISVILVEMWLNWLVNRSHLVDDGQIVLPPISNQQQLIFEQFQRISDWLEHKDINKLNINLSNNNESISTENEDLLHQPVFASVICEALINAEDFEQVNLFLTSALKQHPKDLRLKQLRGLFLSRTGKLKQAEAELRQLLKQFPNDDETIGILAGVIKKLWQAGDQSKLGQWGKLYIKGWQQSKQRNTYLGINAAAYSLWSGDTDASQSIAKAITETYQIRETVLREQLDVQTSRMDYWDLATLAEANLLAGNTLAAEEAYQRLFQDPLHNGKPHQVAANQLVQHLNVELIHPNLCLSQLAKQYSTK